MHPDADEWACSRGLSPIAGPKGLTPLDGFGSLVKDFEHRRAFSLPYNPAYHAVLIGSTSHNPIGVENGNMRRDLENFGIDFYKTHLCQGVMNGRIYRLDLESTSLCIPKTQ